eukprot:scpid26267/ scgid19762/ 
MRMEKATRNNIQNTPNGPRSQTDFQRLRLKTAILIEDLLDSCTPPADIGPQQMQQHFTPCRYTLPLPTLPPPPVTDTIVCVHTEISDVGLPLPSLHTNMRRFLDFCHLRTDRNAWHCVPLMLRSEVNSDAAIAGQNSITACSSHQFWCISVSIATNVTLQQCPALMTGNLTFR